MCKLDIQWSPALYAYLDNVEECESYEAGIGIRSTVYEDAPGVLTQYHEWGDYLSLTFYGMKVLRALQKWLGEECLVRIKEDERALCRIQDARDKAQGVRNRVVMALGEKALEDELYAAECWEIRALEDEIRAMDNILEEAR